MDKINHPNLKPSAIFKKPLAVLTIMLLFVGALAISLTATKPQAARAAWYSDAAWQYRQKVVIDHNRVANTDQTDFPALIKITNAYNTVFTNAKTDGTDILFTSSDGTTKLSHEIDYFSKTGKELDAWVKIPTLSASTDTVLYMYYGNAEAIDQQNKTDVWSNNYSAVWHLKETGTNPTVYDSTANGKNSTGQVWTPSSGQIDGGGSFNASSTTNSIITSFTTAMNDFTICAWYDATAVGGGYDRIVDKSYANGAWIGRQASNANKWGGGVKQGDPFGIYVTLPDNSWHYLCSTRSGTTHTINGDGGAATTSGTVVNTALDTTALTIGNNGGYFKGNIDEVRVASVARSADWIATEYANQAGADAFSIQYAEVNIDNYQTVVDRVWYSPDWKYSQKITIDKTKVTGTQTDFPVLISLTDDANPNSVFEKAQADGDDITFTSTSGTKLSHEIESFVTTSGSRQLVAWVKIPLLTSSYNTDIYLNYGNPTVASQQNKADVWSSSALNNVWHLSEDPTGTAPQMTDSKGALNGTAYGLAAQDSIPAKIKNGLNFATSDRVVTGRPSTVVDNWMIEAWVKPNALDGGEQAIYYNGDDSAGYGLTLVNANIKVLAGGVAWIDSGYTFANTTDCVHVVARRQSGTITFVINGVQQANTSTSVPRTPGNSAEIGHEPGQGGRYLNGGVDELKFYTGVKDNSWITTEYTNQNNPTAFYSLGAETPYDNTAPDNPTAITAKNISGGSVTLASGNFYNYPTPYFSWPEAETAGGAHDGESGVAGYYAYFGTNCSQDPSVSGGNGVLPDTGGGVHYQTGTTISVPDLGANDGTYCLRVTSKDNANNIQTTIWNAFVYKYDSTPPNPVAYIVTDPAGYTTTNSFNFSWTAVSDAAGSQLAGYQYRRAGDPEGVWSDTITNPGVSGIEAYQGGVNVFYVRSVDNVGNFSTTTQTNYYWSQTAPTKPTELTVDPAVADTNSFTFSWSAPVNTLPIVDYGYSINAVPTASNLAWIGSDATSLGPDHFATKQGTNTFYIVAKDSGGNYALDAANVASVEFVCSTTAPPAPVNVSISDSSNHTIDLWALTTKWSAGTGQDPATFSHYAIERSTDNVSFTEIATTTSTAYIDSSGLTNGTTYYYRIRSVDNAGSASAASSVASRAPTGKYTTPPTIVAAPSAEVKSTYATVSWVTNRNSTTTVRYGTSPSALTEYKGQLDSVTSHSALLKGLKGGTTYYYQVLSLDENRDYPTDSAYSATYEFKTLATPAVSTVTISNITLTSADISWETNSASSSVIKYGTSINYDQTNNDANSFVTKHTATIKDLTHSTTYHLKINSTDVDGNEFSSDDYVFDTQKMPEISAVAYQQDNSGANPAIVVEWKTNVPTSSSIEYRPKDGTAVSEESNSVLAVDHKFSLVGLQDSTDYNFVVSGRDQFGNEVVSGENMLRTSNDTRPPKISDVLIEASNVGLDRQDKAQLVVSWKTDEPTTGQVEFGQGLGGDQYTDMSIGDKAMSTSHVVILPDLDPNHPYHLRSISSDAAGNTSKSDDYTAVPGEVPQSVFQVVLKTLQATFGWLSKIF